MKKSPRQRNKNPFAVLLGRKGGKVRSEAKIAAARANGIKARAVAHRNQKERLDKPETLRPGRTWPTSHRASST